MKELKATQLKKHIYEVKGVVFYANNEQDAIRKYLKRKSDRDTNDISNSCFRINYKNI